MLTWILDLLLTGVAILLISAVLPGVEIKNYKSALWVAFLIGFVDATLGWILRFITWPLNYITLGLVYFIIYVIMIMLVDKIVNNFSIRSFWWAFIFALLLSVASKIIDWII